MTPRQLTLPHENNINIQITVDKEKEFKQKLLEKLENINIVEYLNNGEEYVEYIDSDKIKINTIDVVTKNEIVLNTTDVTLGTQKNNEKYLQINNEQYSIYASLYIKPL